MVVIVALYGLTPAFYWIPNAALAAVIIHAVADLVASPSQVYSFWRVSPIEFFIWVAAVLVTIFTTVEVSTPVLVLMRYVAEHLRSTASTLPSRRLCCSCSSVSRVLAATSWVR